jgi:lipopolysaccharide transport protein LptA
MRVDARLRPAASLGGDPSGEPRPAAEGCAVIAISSPARIGACAALVFALTAGAAAPPAGSATSEFAGYTFHFQSAEYNFQSGNFVIPRRFRATRKERTIEGDRVRGNALKKTFVAQGHVVVHQRQPIGGAGDVADLTIKPSVLTCDRLDADAALERYTASGNVHFVEGDRDAVADRGTFDNGLNKLHLEGHVRVRDGANTLIAEAADYDVRSGDFVTPARFTIEREGSSVSADRGSGNVRTQVFTADGNVVADRAPSAPGTDSNPLNAKASHLTAAHLQVEGANKVYVASGNLRFSQGSREASADSGTLDDLHHSLHLDGNVRVREGERSLEAASADYDLTSGAARASGSVIASSPGVTFTAQSANYNLRDGNFESDSRFTVVRGGTTVEGDRVSGNTKTKSFVASGNVVVHQNRSLGRGGVGAFTRRPATLTSDRLVADGAAGTYTATGNAHYTQAALIEQLDRDAVADTMVYDERRDRLHLAGNVRVRDGKSTLTGKTADYDVARAEFNAPQRFSFSRAGTQVEGDSGHGNTRSLKFVVLGNVVVTQTEPLRGRGDVSELTEQPSTLTTDRLDVDGARQYYTATGHVHFSQVEREATAQHGTLDELNHQLHMDGSVKIRDGDRRLDADVLDYNTKTGDVHAAGNVIARGPGAELAGPQASESPPPAPKKKR